MSDIYNVPDWLNSVTYKKNDIVRRTNQFYYSLRNNNLAVTPTNGITNLYWGGVLVDNNNQIKPHFVWTPSYNSNLTLTPRVRLIQFGDGYESRLANGINNLPLILDLTFESRNYDETVAITHFIYSRKGTESFLFTPPSPFNKRKRFVCRELPISLNFYNNNSFRIKMEEVSN